MVIIKLEHVFIEKTTSDIVTIITNDEQSLMVSKQFLLNYMPGLDTSNNENCYNIPYDYETISYFIKFIHGQELNISYTLLYKLYNLSKEYKYDIHYFSQILVNNIQNFDYKSEQNEMFILVNMLEDPQFNKFNVLSQCKLAQLIRIKNLTTNIQILRQIIDIFKNTYNNDLKALRETHNKEINQYETKIYNLSRKATNNIEDLYIQNAHIHRKINPEIEIRYS